MTTGGVVAWTIVKAHSERVPGKNFRPLAGRPLVRWMIDTLVAMPEVRCVVVNTDARAELEAAGVTDGDDVRIRVRPPRLRGDSVTADTLLRDDLESLPEAPLYLMTHATSPFLSPGAIRGAVQAFERASALGQADSLMSVARYQSRFWRPDGSPVNHDPANLVPTQQLETWLEETSALYLFTRAGVRASGSRVGRRPLMHPLSPLDSVDIDTEDDWALAEAIAVGVASRRGLTDAAG